MTPAASRVSPKSPSGMRPLPWPRCAGSTIWHSMSEKTRQQMTTAAMNPYAWPRVPTANIRGRKATAVVTTPKVTGTSTSWAPSIAPASLPPPRDCAEWTFSPTTTASSTSMPSARMNPMTERASME